MPSLKGKGMEPKDNPKLNLNEINRKLAKSEGREYYRSLDEVAGTPEFKKFLEDEFPNRSTLLAMDRRNFLKVMGASLALAGLSGCRFLPQEKIKPYVKAPEDIIPGKSLRYATAMVRRGEALGLVVESKMGRPTKIEGNDLHPASLGSTDVFAQAELLTLYDPDRGRNVLNEGQIATYEEFLKAAREALATSKNARIVTDRIASPTLRSQLQALVKQHPGAEWIEWEPFNDDNALEGSGLVFGTYHETVYDLSKADAIVSLDCSLFDEGPWSVRYARDFAASRKVEGAEPVMNRLYVFESGVTTAGLASDHRFAVKSSEIAGIAQQLLSAIENGSSSGTFDASTISEIAADLMAKKGKAVVVAGLHQPAEVHALALRINNAIGASDNTLHLKRTNRRPLGSDAKKLVAELVNGQVDWLIALSANPLHTLPQASTIKEAYGKIPFSASVALAEDETSAESKWYVPLAHFLEAWSDAEARDGTVAIIQPLIKPLHDAVPAHELVASLAGKPNEDYEIVKGFWEANGIGDKWERALNDGVVPELTRGETRPVPNLATRTEVRNLEPFAFEVNLRPDPTIDDGRYANNGWLQELPKPITTVTWDNTVQMSLKTAEKLGVENEDVVEVTVGQNKVEGPVWIVPGHADDSVTLHAGYGRTKCGRVGEELGFDVFPLMLGGAIVEGSVKKLGKTYQIAAAQTHHSMEGRDIVRVGTIDDYKRDPKLAPAGFELPPHEKTMYDHSEFDNDSQQWGMSIDLNTCIGCNACTVACQAENNIPVVGKDQVHNGREMHWIRIDNYFSGKDGNFEHVVQPVGCQHCEDAPCEPVCPVAATVHSSEGLNQMVYNRCVGTRYCSNNCPYKVRRFNFLNYQYNQKNFDKKDDIPLLKLLNNPDVTVRSRGVMEKCTYCVQRINEARIEAKKQVREVKDGEIVTACQQACPTQAITFGDIRDPNSKVAKAKAEERNYKLLEVLNTRPRTTYSARLRNPNPRIKA